MQAGAAIAANRAVALEEGEAFVEADLGPGEGCFAVADEQALRVRQVIKGTAEFEPGGADVAFTVRGVDVVWESKAEEIVVNGHRAPAPLRGGRQQLVILADRTGLEVFASGGLTYVPMPVNLRADDRSMNVKAIGGPVRFHALGIHELGSAWNSGTESTSP